MKSQRFPSGLLAVARVQIEAKLSLWSNEFGKPGKCLDQDLAAAGIAKVDDRGRTVDVYAFRHTFGTLLSKSGVAPRTAQQAMRHCDIKLTMNTYTDPRLLGVAGAVEALPALPALPIVSE